MRSLHSCERRFAVERIVKQLSTLRLFRLQFDMRSTIAKCKGVEREHVWLGGTSGKIPTVVMELDKNRFLLSHCLSLGKSRGVSLSVRVLLGPDYKAALMQSEIWF